MNAYAARIETLAAEAERDVERFEQPADIPAESEAMEYLREGVGPAVAVYLEARTGDWHRFETDSFDALEDAMNSYLELYAACYGVDIDAEFTIREAAEVLIETHNIHDVAQVLTHVPDRNAR